jgi:hypothetical protein
MSEYDVMTLAGHSDSSTTHGFYLAVNPNLVDRARKATASSVRHFVTSLSQVPFSDSRNNFDT